MALRFGLFGTGDWARDVHAAGLMAEPDAELVGVWGRNADKARALAEHWGIQPYDDIDALVDDVDAIAVALPPDVQPDIAVRAAHRGRHLLLDKPLALDLATAERVVEAVDAAGVSSVVFFTLRFAQPVAEWLPEVVAEGPWLGLRAAWLSSLFHQEHDRKIDSPWRLEYGALWDVGPHMLSLVLPLLGPVIAVVCTSGAGDTRHLVLRHEGDASSTITLSHTVPPAAAIEECAVYGDAGWRAMPPRSETTVEAYRSAVHQLVEAAERGRSEHACDVRFARDVVAVLAAAAAAVE